MANGLNERRGRTAAIRQSRVIPFWISKWSDNCAGKIDNNKAEIEVTSYSNYKISNVVISSFNQQE